MKQTLRDKSKWAQPKAIHTIKGVTHTFDQVCTRARAVQSTGNVRVKLPKGMSRSKLIQLRINTYRARDTIIDGLPIPNLPPVLKAPLIDLHKSYKQSKELVQTILEVRARHPRV